MADDLFADLIPPAPARHYRAARALARRMSGLSDEGARLRVGRLVCGQITAMLLAQARLRSLPGEGEVERGGRGLARG